MNPPTEAQASSRPRPRRSHWLGRASFFLGFDPWQFLRSIFGLPWYLRDSIQYSRQTPRPSFRIRLRNLFPALGERAASAGSVGGHYFHQDLWAAHKIFLQRPEKHIDIGSRIDGFVAHLLSSMPVTVVDIRPLESEIAGLEFVQDDATELRSFADGSIASISSLHAAEHFGLGRYGDPVDPDACFRFMTNLERVLRPGGRLYFSVPIGRERVEFNAHRVFAPETILSAFPGLSLLSFSYYVDDNGNLHEGCDPQHLPHIEYGCGLFEFIKPERS